MWTTAATFYGLTFVDFPSLQQLGRLIGHSMVICGVLTLVLVPALLPARHRPRASAADDCRGWPAGSSAAARAILVAAALVDRGARASRRSGCASTRRSTGCGRSRPAPSRSSGIGRAFGLPSDVYVVARSAARRSSRCSTPTSGSRGGCAATLPAARVPAAVARCCRRTATQAPTRAARSQTPGSRRATSPRALERRADVDGLPPGHVRAVRRASAAAARPGQRLTYDGYAAHGLGDLIGRFVVARRPTAGRSRPTPSRRRRRRRARCEQLVGRDGDATPTLTGLPLVNHELASRFLPQFLKGLAIGTVIVLVLDPRRVPRLAAVAAGAAADRDRPDLGGRPAGAGRRRARSVRASSRS